MSCQVVMSRFVSRRVATSRVVSRRVATSRVESNGDESCRVKSSGDEINNIEDKKRPASIKFHMGIIIFQCESSYNIRIHQTP